MCFCLTWINFLAKNTHGMGIFIAKMFLFKSKTKMLQLKLQLIFCYIWSWSIDSNINKKSQLLNAKATEPKILILLTRVYGIRNFSFTAHIAIN